MDRQWITCNACGRDNYQQYAEFQGWPIGKCGGCGLVYVNPVPVFKPNAEFSAISQGFEYTRYMHREISAAVLQHERRQLEFQQAEIGMLLGKRFRPHRQLEIGCGSGASVRAAQDLGWEALGIDIDPALIAKGREQLQVDLRCTPLLESNLPAESFDFIRLRDVIEHLPNPFACLCEIGRLLTPGGVAFFATPNEGSLAGEVKALLGRQIRTVATVNPPHHVHGFSPETLRRILIRSDLEILRIKTVSPVDRGYVTSNNMRSVYNLPMVAFWALSKALGRGSMLVAWVKKPG